MAPLFLILSIVVLGGLAFAGYNLRKTGNPASSPTQMTYPSGTNPSPTSGSTGASQVAPSTPTGYQAGISLAISSPVNGTQVATPNITVKGKTAPDAEVFVNDSSGHADINGLFSIPITLEEGNNTIVITVNDANGNSAEQEVMVTYTPAQ